MKCRILDLCFLRGKAATAFSAS